MPVVVPAPLTRSAETPIIFSVPLELPDQQKPARQRSRQRVLSIGVGAREGGTARMGPAQHWWPDGKGQPWRASQEAGPR